jgi:hypothetical protein
MEEMPYDELLKWYEYFDRRPIGWREDDRTAKIVQAQGAKIKATDLFPSLKKIYEPDQKYKPDDPMSTFKGSWFERLMQQAVGGDKIDL